MYRFSVRTQLGMKTRPIGISHCGSKAQPMQIIFGELVSLLVVDHLQSMFCASQKTISRMQSIRFRLVYDPEVRQCLHRLPQPIGL